ncbi:hypothetical protein [Candidatus Palauibacter sp.]|uniref:hypothetical protein n=1 Tax=Candidatus Palauibacter sp. TaxID=3101350 RepID=UPI003B5A4A9F
MLRFGVRWLVVSGLLSAAAAEVHAQTLYAENGVEVRALAKIIECGAERCRYANGDDDFVSCTDGHEYTAPVGSFAPNAFGLHDARTLN